MNGTKYQDYKKGMRKEILSLAFPAILSNITVPLLGLSDTFISGHLGSEMYIGAVSVGTVMVNSIFMLMGFLRMGTTGLTSEAFGAEDDISSRRIFTAAVTLGALFGLLMIVFCLPLEKLLGFIISSSPEVASMGSDYFYIVVSSAPAQLAVMGVTGWMIGRQNTLYPMIVSISVNVVNIALSFLFVLGLDMGFIGIAAGTAAANWFGLIMSLYFARLLAPDRILWCGWKSLREGMDFRRFFSVNANLLLRSACLLAVTVAMTSYSGRLGNMSLAVNAVLMQFFLFFSYFMDGFAFSGEALCGRFAGARDALSLRKSIKMLLRISGVVAMSFFIIYLLFTPDIAAFLTDESGVVAGVTDAKWIACLIPVLSVSAFMYDGVYIGLTATRPMFYATLTGMILFFTAHAAGIKFLADILSPLNVLWAAFLIFLLARGVILMSLLPYELKSHI